MIVDIWLWIRDLYATFFGRVTIHLLGAICITAIFGLTARLVFFKRDLDDKPWSETPGASRQSVRSRPPDDPTPPLTTA